MATRKALDAHRRAAANDYVFLDANGAEVPEGKTEPVSPRI